MRGFPRRAWSRSSGRTRWWSGSSESCPSARVAGWPPFACGPVSRPAPSPSRASSPTRTWCRRSSRTRRTFPAATRRASVRRRPKSEVAALLRRASAILADRRAVVADRRRHADGRDRPQHGAPQPHPRDRTRLRARRSRRALAELDAALARAGRYYPPAPTFTGAFVGGTVATNAAGAATFKYGATRDWVAALTVVLADRRRARHRARRRSTRTPTATSRSLRRTRTVARAGAALPDAGRAEVLGRLLRRAGHGPHRSVHRLGRHARRRSPAVTLRVAARAAGDVPGARCRSPIGAPPSRSSRGCATTARETWRIGDPRGIDVSAIEHMDARCLDAAARGRRRPPQRRRRCPTARRSRCSCTLELPPGTTRRGAFDEIGRARETRAPDTPLVRFCRALDEAGVLDDVRDGGAGRSRRAPRSSSPSAKRCPTPSTSASGGRSRRSTRASRRPPRT